MNMIIPLLVAWVALAIPVALITGKGVAVADRATTVRRCWCYRPIKDPAAILCAEHD